jgi:hypothetical protein
VTIEPGIYFVPALLNDADFRQRHRDNCRLGEGGAHARLRRHTHRGNVLITGEGFELLTDDNAPSWLSYARC